MGLVVELPRRRDVHRLPDFAPRVVLVDPGTGHEISELVVDLHPVGGTSDVWDVGGFVQRPVRDELDPEPNWVPVHADDADVAFDEVVHLEVVRFCCLSEQPALTLHPAAELDGEAPMVLKVLVLPSPRMPVDVGQGLDQKHQRSAGADDPLRR